MGVDIDSENVDLFVAPPAGGLVKTSFNERDQVAVARKLGIRLWIMLRNEIDYHEFCRRGQKQQNSGAACAGMPGTR